jgi:hypothetical protein
MQTKSIIQTSANVIRITNLKKGDVYKRIDDSSYSDKVRYGVVVNLYNNGEKTYLEALEYKVGFGDITAERAVISGEMDVAIFPATAAEVEEHFSSALRGIEKKISDKREEILKLESTLTHGKEFVSGEMAQKLTEPQFKEMSQREYLVGKQQAELEAVA